MGKVIKLNEDFITVAEFLDSCVETAKTEQAESVMFAYKRGNQWVTGYYNSDFATRQEGVANMQVDLIDSMIRANMDRYVEYV